MDIPNQLEIRKRFAVHEERRVNIVKELTERVELILSPLQSKPTVKGRIKDFDSYYKKLLKSLKADGEYPLITDMMGIRVICPFLEDLEAVEDLIKRNVTVIEVERKGQSTYREFGYESNHLLIKIPPDILQKWGNTDFDVAEFQIRTLLQDAWAEVEHELVYKSEFNPFDNPMKRKLAAVNASLSLADLIFQEIRTYQRQLNGELGKRRESFFQKI
jgi:putative GTP pyrophosphokinase